MKNKTREQIENYEAEIRRLTTDLAWSADYGDYKIIKTYEARLTGKEDPYDVEKLITERTAARARINELQALISSLREGSAE